MAFLHKWPVTSLYKNEITGETLELANPRRASASSPSAKLVRRTETVRDRAAFAVVRETGDNITSPPVDESTEETSALARTASPRRAVHPHNVLKSSLRKADQTTPIHRDPRNKGMRNHNRRRHP